MTLSRTTSSRVQGSSFLFRSLYTLIAIATLTSYASLFRPLWLDEALHYALAGQGSLWELVVRLHNPDPGFLTRQTGFYQLVNFITLNVIDPTWFALRLPSVLSGVLLICAVYLFLAERHVGPAIQITALLFLAGQAGFMYYVGEARPYLPFAATVMGCLTYLTTDSVSPRWPYIRVLGWVCLYVGAVMHLYFLLTLPVILLFNIFYRSLPLSTRPGWRQIIFWSRPRIVGGAVMLALGVGLLTWMRPQETNTLGAFEWMGGSAYSTITSFTNFHFDFLGVTTAAATILVSQLMLVGWLLLKRLYRIHADLFASAVLLFLGLGTSLLIALSSVANNYAIATRQLVLGPLLVAVSLAWQIGSLAKLARRLPFIPPMRVHAILLGSAMGAGTATLLYLFLSNRSGIAISVATSIFLGLTAVVATWRHARSTKGVTALSALMASGATLLGLQVSDSTLSVASTFIFLAIWGITFSGIVILAARFRSSLTLGSLVSTFALLLGLVIAFDAAEERFRVIQGDHVAMMQLVEELDETEPSELAVLMDPTREEQAELREEIGGEWWVWLANLNSLSGDSIWPVFDQF